MLMINTHAHTDTLHICLVDGVAILKIQDNLLFSHIKTPQHKLQ